MSDLRTVFKRVDYTLDALLHYIDIGDIGLPDIQRPFVWSPTKVRDLFDSMYKGFPVGYLLFWENANANSGRQIGTDDKVRSIPSRLIVDGQQRLTSLYSVFRGKPVINDNYVPKRIEIAFRPRDSKFEVADAAIRRDPEFIADISKLWSSGRSSWSLVNEFLKTLEDKQSLSDVEKEKISHSLDRLFDLQKYPFTALEVAPSVEEEQVADIFVRINSEGVKLNQADFILTLLSVFGEDLRISFESFCRESRIAPAAGVVSSPYNHFINPNPDQLLRVAIAVGHYRGRLKSVYHVLRGKDLETGEFSVEKRETQFNILREAQKKTLNVNSWHSFFRALIGAGFKSGDLISSENTLLYTYAIYLIGKTRFNIPEHDLDKLIGRWFYTTTLSGRYIGSFETQMESDLNVFKELPNGNAFLEAAHKIIQDTLTHDFWDITLPNELDTSSGRSPAMFAYYAAQNMLNVPVLFSSKKISDLFDPSLKPGRSAMEKHHLFPRAYLESIGIKDLKRINQVGNFAFLEWPDNAEISDEPPSSYLSRLKKRFPENVWADMCALHALPDGWENMDYNEFLGKRRLLMAGIIKKGFEALG